ncbi:MAG: acetyl-CoA carboxylase biotin carboxyl carrier protein [Phycisphaerales bacterium]|nr:acetyl-CoA carboxylase biotin carboxyl carrier protein [Phycisphaerales bacterium]
MIDINKLKELVQLMVENDLSELDLQDQDETVTLKRGAAPVVQAAPVYAAPPQHIMPGAAGPAHAGAAPAAGPAAPASDAGLVAVESPMVGTFYASPNPDSPPFVKAGGSISPGTVVCLIEAMKVFNEIKSEVNGMIERVLVKNGEAVEFGQKLFLVRPQ